MAKNGFHEDRCYYFATMYLLGNNKQRNQQIKWGIWTYIIQSD